MSIIKSEHPTIYSWVTHTEDADKYRDMLGSDKYILDRKDIFNFTVNNRQVYINPGEAVLYGHHVFLNSTVGLTLPSNMSGKIVIRVNTLTSNTVSGTIAGGDYMYDLHNVQILALTDSEPIYDADISKAKGICDLWLHTWTTNNATATVTRYANVAVPGASGVLIPPIGSVVGSYNIGALQTAYVGTTWVLLTPGDANAFRSAISTSGPLGANNGFFSQANIMPRTVEAHSHPLPIHAHGINSIHGHNSEHNHPVNAHNHTGTTDPNYHYHGMNTGFPWSGYTAGPNYNWLLVDNNGDNEPDVYGARTYGNPTQGMIYASGDMTAMYGGVWAYTTTLSSQDNTAGSASTSTSLGLAVTAHTANVDNSTANTAVRFDTNMHGIAIPFYRRTA